MSTKKLEWLHWDNGTVVFHTVAEISCKSYLRSWWRHIMADHNHTEVFHCNKVAIIDDLQPELYHNIWHRSSENQSNAPLKWRKNLIIFSDILTLSTPDVPNYCCSDGSAPYWSNPSFLISDIRHCGAQSLAPEGPNVKNGKWWVSGWVCRV